MFSLTTTKSKFRYRRKFGRRGTIPHFLCTKSIYVKLQSHTMAAKNICWLCFEFFQKKLELFVRVDLVRCLLRHDIQVVLLQESKILAGLRELAFFHTLTDVPVDEGALGVHHVVLLGDALGEHSAHSHIVSDHNDVLLRGCHDITGDGSGRGSIQSDLETSWAPFDEADLVVLLQPLNGGVSLLRHDVSSPM